jgi:hypothetical protein
MADFTAAASGGENDRWSVATHGSLAVRKGAQAIDPTGTSDCSHNLREVE